MSACLCPTPAPELAVQRVCRCVRAPPPATKNAEVLKKLAGISLNQPPFRSCADNNAHTALA